MRENYDFKNAKRAKDVPHLARLQAETKGKTRITIMLDNLVLEAFRARAEQAGVGYQTMINSVLRDSLAQETLTEESLRRVLREELGTYRAAGKKK